MSSSIETVRSEIARCRQILKDSENHLDSLKSGNDYMLAQVGAHIARLNLALVKLAHQGPWGCLDLSKFQEEATPGPSGKKALIPKPKLAEPSVN